MTNIYTLGKTILDTRKYKRWSMWMISTNAFMLAIIYLILISPRFHSFDFNNRAISKFMLSDDYKYRTEPIFEYLNLSNRGLEDGTKEFYAIDPSQLGLIVSIHYVPKKLDSQNFSEQQKYGFDIYKNIGINTDVLWIFVCIEALLLGSVLFIFLGRTHPAKMKYEENIIENLFSLSEPAFGTTLDTGYGDIDQRIARLLDAIRSREDISDRDLDNVSKVLSALSHLAGRAVQDAEFDGAWTESEFQRYIRQELRRSPKIGADLDEHPHAAGGITDLAYQGIPIELKVSHQSHPFKLEDCPRFFEQTASYAIGKGKRVAVLCVLDCSPKTSTAQPAEELIEIFNKPTETGSVAILVVVIQGNLGKPASFSR